MKKSIGSQDRRRSMTISRYSSSRGRHRERHGVEALSWFYSDQPAKSKTKLKLVLHAALLMYLFLPRARRETNSVTKARRAFRKSIRATSRSYDLSRD